MRPVGGAPRVEVDHAGVADHAALDQRGDGPVVLLGGREVGRRPDGRPAGHDDGPVRRVPGVAALEERGTGTHRQQYGQPGADPPGDPHGEIAVVHPDVHLAGAHLLLVDEVAVLRRHPFVPAVGENPAAAAARGRYRAPPRDGQPHAARPPRPVPPPGPPGRPPGGAVPVGPRGGRPVAAGAAVLAALAVVRPPAAASAAPTADTSYSFRSAAGDYIGGGQSRTYRAPTASVTVSGTAADLEVSVSGNGNTWEIDLG